MTIENASGQPEGQGLPADTNQQNVTGTGSQETQTEKTFTQAELDAIVQKRTAKADRRAEARYAALEAQIAELKQPKPAEAKTESEPKRTDFESYEAFVEARAEWRADQKVIKRLEEFEGKTAKKDEDSKRARAQQEFEKRVSNVIEAGQKAYPDFDAVINEAVEDGLIPTKGALYEAIMDSEMGEKLVYHLAKHPSEAERINKLGPLAQVRELGKLEDRLSAKKEPRETMEPIGGRTTNSTGPLNDSLSTEAWIAARNKQLKSR